MFVHVSVVGVLLAALSAMIIGMIWYSPAVFGKPWMKMMGINDKDMKNKMTQATAWLVVASLVTAYVLAHFIAYTYNYAGGSWLSAAVLTSLWVWLGFVATAIVAHGVFDPRDKKVHYINAGNRLVTLVIMALILTPFMK